MPDQTQARSMIYGYCSGVSRVSGLLSGIALAEDGTYLGCGRAGTEELLLIELGLGFLPPSFYGIHAQFRAHYPDGYTLEYVWRFAAPTHAGLQRAIRLYMYGQPAASSPSQSIKPCNSPY